MCFMLVVPYNIHTCIVINVGLAPIMYVAYMYKCFRMSIPLPMHLLNFVYVFRELGQAKKYSISFSGLPASVFGCWAFFFQ